MAAIPFNTNIASLEGQRQLADSTRTLSKTQERLSSGLRINRPGDDAAGLSISASLDTDARVYTQGIRNFNDGVSLLNIAEGATDALSDIVIRLKELASQSANGTLSLVQRTALNKEAGALVNEYNRTIRSIDFNGTKLLDDVSNLTLQGGYGQNGSISFALGSKLARTVGDGTFQTATVQSSSGNPTSVSTADFNGDGKLDLVTTTLGTQVDVMLGNGDGTFRAKTSFATLYQSWDVTSGDLNGDGKMDLAVADSNRLVVLLGNGNGTFQAPSNAGTQTDIRHVITADFDADGALDIAVTENGATQLLNVYHGNGNGTFRAPTSISTSAFTTAIVAADFNGDGRVDLAVGEGQTTAIYLGNGNLTFQARQTYTTTGNLHDQFVSADINGDGALDIISNDSYSNLVRVFYGRGDGTFAGFTNLSTGAGTAPNDVAVADMNGDGFVDILAANTTTATVSLFLGNGDGTFFAQRSFAAGSGSTQSLVTGDFSGDGAIDVATANAVGTASVLVANPQQITTLAPVDLSTRASALLAMPILDDALARVAAERGAIGAVQSRLQTATSSLAQQVGNYLEAKSRIVDADIAEEAANLVRGEILQHSAIAILSQANQLPQLVLKLI